MRTTNEYQVHQSKVVAFAELLETYQLKNEIGYAVGDCISITVWCDDQDEQYDEYIDKLQALED